MPAPWGSGIGGGPMINPVALARSFRPPVVRPRPLNQELAKFAAAQRVGLPPRMNPMQQQQMARTRLMEPSRATRIVREVLGTHKLPMRGGR